MKPSIDEIKGRCPGIDPRLVENHLARLDDRYFDRFNTDAVVAHLQGLARLTPENPVVVLTERLAENRVACTTLAFNYDAEFSLITGVLSGLGFNIENGGIHTYSKVSQPQTNSGIRPKPGRTMKIKIDPMLRRRIVDHFVGTIESELDFPAWTARLEDELSKILSLLEKNDGQFMVKARHIVNELVARRLEKIHHEAPPVLYPVEITIDNHEDAFTRLKVVSQDTPVFLYAMSNALSVRKTSIEHVRIQTKENRIEDVIDIVDEKGNALKTQEQLDQVRLSVLITKQFTHFLGVSPDPYAALTRFETLVEDVLRLPDSGQWQELLSEPKILKELAQLLGASDFLWEDMIRQQYETLLPMLRPHVTGRRFAESLATLPDRLEAYLEGATDMEEREKRLNEFKDKEIFLFDLDHILAPETDFKTLSEHLTFLAEVVVKKAVVIIYADLVGRYGHPRTVAGLEARYAILGLGKFGGAALGYASDIELMVVYSDNGQTDGPKGIGNAEFFDLMVRQLTKLIRAKREGIFNIDLRLRPYGNDGPLACSLESFGSYFGQGGPAHAAERLALVRMRAVAGDHAFGSRLERMRDEFIYATKNIDVPALRELRRVQFKEKNKPNVLNAKFSPGALVDLEYDVQILQVIYGQDHPRLRTPRIHVALKGLHEAGVLSGQEVDSLVSANDFLRNLINGLRMLRGSAKDLFLPPIDSLEYTHLAKRLGYVRKDGMAPEKQLHLEFETRTAQVRAFVERHFGRDSLPGPAMGNAADVILSDELAPEIGKKIMQDAGFTNPERAYFNLKKLAGEAGRRESFARLAVLAVDILKNGPDPDMALNNWEHFENHLEDKTGHFESIFAQPMRLEILLGIFSASQFLSDTLARNPEFIEYVTDHRQLYDTRSVQTHREHLRDAGHGMKNEQDWMNFLRKYRRREILRIGTRDMVLHAPLADVTMELSNLADALVQVVLERAWNVLQEKEKTADLPWDDLHGHFCILAFGKLGGHELNYSSDIDLVGVCDEHGHARRNDMAQQVGDDPYALAMESVRAYLGQYTEEGAIFRVDLRLRPHGVQGQLIPTSRSMVKYYGAEASLGELQSLLKARPIAGDSTLGVALMRELHALVCVERNPAAVVESVEKMRNYAISQSKIHGEKRDVKSGKGGLRDIEFLVQGMQMIHCHHQSLLLEGNTLVALPQLARLGYLTQPLADQLADDYIFLRRVEHCLQIMEDQQIHALPRGSKELDALAKRLLGIEADDQFFNELLNKVMIRVREAYEIWVVKKKFSTE